MNCPFLREETVRYCDRAGSRKPIPARGTEGRCYDGSYVDCPVYRRQPKEPQAHSKCPLLVESVMQYCSASAVTKFIPRSGMGLSRCVNGAYHYCDLYLELTRSGEEAHDDADSISLPENLSYTTNHWWMELATDGPCHLGIDAFLARLLGSVDRVEFLACGGITWPAVVLSFNGNQSQTVFPESVSITGFNTYLRRDPARLCAEPYSRGWLLEASVDEGTRDRLRSVLMDAAAARRWVEQENLRVNERVQRVDSGLAADGGLFVAGLLRELDRESSLRLFHEFVTRQHTWRDQPR